MDMTYIFNHTTKSDQKERKVPNGWKTPFFGTHCQMTIGRFRCQATATWWTGMDLVPVESNEVVGRDPPRLHWWISHQESIFDSKCANFPSQDFLELELVILSTLFQLIHPKFITEKGDPQRWFYWKCRKLDHTLTPGISLSRLSPREQHTTTDDAKECQESGRSWVNVWSIGDMNIH